LYLYLFNIFYNLAFLNMFPLYSLLIILNILRVSRDNIIADASPLKMLFYYFVYIKHFSRIIHFNKVISNFRNDLFEILELEPSWGKLNLVKRIVPREMIEYYFAIFHNFEHFLNYRRRRQTS